MTTTTARPASPTVPLGAAATVPAAPATTPRPRRRRSRLGVSGWVSVVVLGLAAVAALAPGLLTGTDPTATDPLAAFQPPGADHLAGTDSLGRDIFSRIVHGARYSLLIGVAATALALVVGVTVGLLAGVAGRVADTVLTRALDVLASFPEILLALVLIAFTGPGIGNLVLALAVAGVPRYARVVRAQVFVVQGQGYVEQARTFGLSRARLVLRHVLPNALGTVPVLATIGLGTAIIGAAGLSFLGLGPQAPTPEWGSMLAENRDYLRVAWWGGILPGLALTSTVIAATVLGRRLQAVLERRAA